MDLTTDIGEISVVDERAYTFGSADNTRGYPFAHSLGSEEPVSIHGVLLNGQPLAVFGASGGATGVHEHSALWLNGRFYLAVGDSIVCMTLAPFELLWTLRVDTATCFGIHFHVPTGALIAHGELEITRFTERGSILWQASGRDIFTGPFALDTSSIAAEDFNGDQYRFLYDTGKNAA
jgi:hypothetical protein